MNNLHFLIRYPMFCLLFLPLTACQNDSASDSTEEQPANNQNQEQTAEKSDQQDLIAKLIFVDQPAINEAIQSPFTIKGQAVGYWYFEGDFPVYLVDADGNRIGEAIAVAQGPWMTEELVPFEATITFDPPERESGQMVFQRSNPSDLPENDMEYVVPVTFAQQ